MQTYRVSIVGRNFLMEMEGKPGKFGFYSTRYVEASDADAAATIAVEAVIAEHDIARNTDDDPPLVIAEEVEEIAGLHGIVNSKPGMTFFPEDDVLPESGE